MPPPQSALVSHSTQPPCRQNRAVAGHCESLVHVTQPSVALHCVPAGHALVPFGPQIALPPPGPAGVTSTPPVLELPPHAMRIAKATIVPVVPKLSSADFM